MRAITLTISSLVVAASVVTASAAFDLNLRDDLAVYHYRVSTKSVEAQKWFDQGLVLYYGFNHEAAIMSFQKAAELDPSLAMAWWGQAIAAGPNINNPAMDDAANEAAYAAAQRALALAKKPDVSQTEKDLIVALSKRYAQPAPEDRSALDQAYADAMRTVWKQHPDDPDIGALTAESLMDLHPWDLWTPGGEARPWTPEIMETLETVIAQVPDHPMANHLYIHTMESSPTPEKALPSAAVLADRVPGAGHLVHMPAHIYIRLGRYKDAVVANEKAIQVDKSWADEGGFYTLYRAHNYHFLAYAAMFDGQKEVAMRAAHEMVEQIPLDLVRAYPDFLDAFLGVPVHVMVRFGMWNELLAEKQPPEDLYVTTAYWRYGRTVALAALGRVDEASAEMAAFRKACDAIPESRLMGNNSARTVMDVGLAMAEGEVEYRKGNYDRAFDLLRTGVKRDVALKYDEPWGWMMPVSHSLGALLVEQKHYKEAEQVYRADLALHPGNGWALYGLSECLRATGRPEEASSCDARFKDAWSRSDIMIKGSCFCKKGS